MPEADWKRAFVSDKKLIGYLLSLDHEDGRSKAEFFARRGYSAPGRLRRDLVALAQGAPRRKIRTEHGFKYVVEGIVSAPDGSRYTLRSIWHQDKRSTIPRLVTAYPIAS